MPHIHSRTFLIWFTHTLTKKMSKRKLKLRNIQATTRTTVFSKIQLEGDPKEKDPKKRKTKLSNELFNKDVSKVTNNPITTDEALLEISNRKENIRVEEK